MTLDEWKAQQTAIKELEEFTDKAVSLLNETQKDETHQALCKEAISAFVDRVHQINCIFKRGGLLQAKICVGTVTYDVALSAQNATKEEFSRWEDDLLGGNNENFN